MACSKQYGLSDEEKHLMEACDMGEDIDSETRKMNRRIKKRLENWTAGTQGNHAGIANTSILLFGMGGVGKSALGNVLLGQSNAFGVSNRARAETNKVTGLKGRYEGREFTVYDTPGYLTRKLLHGEASPEEAARQGLSEVRGGIHVLILVVNGSNLRNLENEAHVIQKANLLNGRTFKHCIMVVTHAGAKYSGKSVNDFIRDASASPEFSALIEKINRRVVLVELGDNTPLTSAALESNPYYSDEKEASRDMVFDIVSKVTKANAAIGSILSVAAIIMELAICFPALATVLTPQGKRTMHDLNYNDDVLVMDSQGQVQYEKVIMFSHANPSLTSYFCTISTKDGKVLQLSPGHLLHVGEIGKLTAAQDIKVGDVVFTCDENQNLNPAQVATISGEWLTGIYCPHTPSGSIIVDGVAASCYTNLLSPTLAHAAMLPVRVAHCLLPNDWFKWMVPYDKEQGMPNMALRVSKLMKWA